MCRDSKQDQGVQLHVPSPGTASLKVRDHCCEMLLNAQTETAWHGIFITFIEVTFRLGNGLMY